MGSPVIHVALGEEEKKTDQYLSPSKFSAQVKEGKLNLSFNQNRLSLLAKHWKDMFYGSEHGWPVDEFEWAGGGHPLLRRVCHC